MDWGGLRGCGCFAPGDLAKLGTDSLDAGLQGAAQMAIIGVVQGLNGRAGPPVQVVAGEQFPDKFPPQLGGHGTVGVQNGALGQLDGGHQHQVGVELLGGGVVGELGIAGQKNLAHSDPSAIVFYG